jgi:hypothetical protein
MHFCISSIAQAASSGFDTSPPLSEDDLANAEDTSGELISPKTKEMMEKAQEDASLVNGFIIDQVNNLFSIPGVSSIQNLVFGNPYKTWGFGKDPDDKLIDGVFYQSELDNVVHPLIALFSGAYVTILMLAIMLSSLKVGFNAHSPQAKEDFWKDVYMYVASAFFMGLFWVLFHTLMAINWGIVQGIAEMLKSRGKPLDGISIIATATNDSTYKFQMGDILVFLAEWGLALYLNFIYISRKIILIIHCGLSSAAAYSLLFARTRYFFGTYMKELIGAIYLPSIHAAVLFIFVQLAANLGQGMGPTIFKLGMIIMFIPVTGMISRWLQLGDSSTALGRAATFMGLGAIGGAIMLSKGAMNMFGVGRGGARGDAFTGNEVVGAATPGGTGVSMGNDAGASSITRAAEGGQMWHKFKKAGAIGGAVLGGTFALPFGPAGVTAGAALGAKAATSVLQAGRNTAVGVAGAITTLRNAGQGVDADGNPTGFKFSNLKNKFTDLAERRQLFGTMGEAAGKTFGVVGAGIGMLAAGPVGGAVGFFVGNRLTASGKVLGQMLSGVSRQRAFEFGSGTLPDGTISPRGMTMDQIAEDPRFSGSVARWNQTNDRSWFEIQDKSSGNWITVGGYGAGDPNLHAGQRRMMDYQIRRGAPEHGGEIWKRQENGSYVLETKLPQTTESDGQFAPKNRIHREIVGLSGSNAHFGRTSEAYIADTSGKKLYSDNSFDTRRLNIEDYFNYSQPGNKRLDDKAADFVGVSIPKAAKATGRNLAEGVKQLGWAQAATYNRANRKSDIV